MTRRERLEAKRDKREEWAEARGARARRDFAAADMSEERTGIPFGQPILVGHHSEGRHRRAIERADRAMGRAVENSDMAKHHASCAEGIQRQLDHSIFSDDEDAIERLEARAAEADRDAELANEVNKVWRKAVKDGKDPEEAIAPLVGAEGAARLARTAKQFSYLMRKGPASATSSRAEARRARERIALVKAQQQRLADAARAGGVSMRAGTGSDWVVITFAEKPARKILDALHAAEFRWRSGSWAGLKSRIPAEVLALLPETEPEATSETQQPAPSETACRCDAPLLRFSKAEIAGALPGQVAAPVQSCELCRLPVPELVESRGDDGSVIVELRGATVVLRPPEGDRFYVKQVDPPLSLAEVTRAAALIFGWPSLVVRSTDERSELGEHVYVPDDVAMGIR